jgi:predicted enzyme related to lactoylglutathione lyase
MDLGNFSISLSVRDITASKEFYETIGFSVFHGAIKEKWLIMKNETATIGLFQGMFEKNILTFNPGWDSDAKPLDTFMDVRDIQKTVQKKGIDLIRKVEEGTKGPASITMLDPDGNTILIDQHI